eukprot:2674463-Alexandrium_andersonii.AAC.1
MKAATNLRRNSPAHCTRDAQATCWAQLSQADQGPSKSDTSVKISQALALPISGLDKSHKSRKGTP